LTWRERVTDRLRLRPAEPGDVEFLTRVHAARGAGMADTRRVQTFVCDSEIWWRSHGYGVWVASWQDGGDAAAWCSLRPLREPNEPELSYGVRAEDRGLRRTLLEGIDSVIYSIDRGEFERRDRSFTTR
jgi:hypothetical protein